MESGVWSILHLMDSSGNFLNYNEFTNTFNVKCTKKQFAMVIKAIPQAMGNLVRGMLPYEKIYLKIILKKL